MKNLFIILISVYLFFNSAVFASEKAAEGKVTSPFQSCKNVLLVTKKNYEENKNEWDEIQKKCADKIQFVQEAGLTKLDPLAEGVEYMAFAQSVAKKVLETLNKNKRYSDCSASCFKGAQTCAANNFDKEVQCSDRKKAIKDGMIYYGRKLRMELALSTDAPGIVSANVLNAASLSKDKFINTNLRDFELGTPNPVGRIDLSERELKEATRRSDRDRKELEEEYKNKGYKNYHNWMSLHLMKKFDEHRARYREILYQEAPIFSVLDRPKNLEKGKDPAWSDEQIAQAFSKLSNNSVATEEKVQQSIKTSKLEFSRVTGEALKNFITADKDLLYYVGMKNQAEAVLKENPSFCGAATSMEERMHTKDMQNAGIALAATVVASPVGGSLLRLGVALTAAEAAGVTGMALGAAYLGDSFRQYNDKVTEASTSSGMGKDEEGGALRTAEDIEKARDNVKIAVALAPIDGVAGLKLYSSVSNRVLAKEMPKLSVTASKVEKAENLAPATPAVKDQDGRFVAFKEEKFKELKAKYIEPSFAKLLTIRAGLKEKYKKVADSVEDFNPKADHAIEGKAKLLVDPEEAYLAKIMMIRKAKHSIDISYYIFNDDATGRALLHELRLAIKRGVKVRIMVDSLGTIGSTPFYTDLKALMALRGGFMRDVNGKLTTERATAEAVVINPIINVRGHVKNWYNRAQNLLLKEGDKLPVTTIGMNRRSHDKILMIDSSSPDSMAIIGGRNIADEYYGVADSDKKTYQDLEIILKNITKEDAAGNPTNALENHYNKLYFYLANKKIEDFLIKVNRDEVRDSFKKMRESNRAVLSANKKKDFEKEITKMEDENFLDENFEGGMISIVNEIQNFSRTKAFLSPMGAHNKVNPESLQGRLTEEMKKAKKSISICSPYLWLSDDDITFIKKWLAEDPTREFKIVTNSISTTDVVAAQAMVDTVLGPKLITELKGSPIASQIKMYAYGKMDDSTLGGDVDYGMIHAKFTIIDGEKVMIKTSNMDPRSRYLNSELGVFFEGNDKAAAKELDEYFKKLADMSYEWGSEDWKKVRETEANKVPLRMQNFSGKVIKYFNLLPLL